MLFVGFFAFFSFLLSLCFCNKLTFIDLNTVHFSLLYFGAITSCALNINSVKKIAEK